MEANLDAQGLWEAVVPAEDAAAAIIAKKDKPARAYLLSALAEDILLQVSAKKTAAEVWASLKARFVGADRVRTSRLSTLRGEFDRLDMADGEKLDDFAGKISGMAARYANLGVKFRFWLYSRKSILRPITRLRSKPILFALILMID